MPGQFARIQTVVLGEGANDAPLLLGNIRLMKMRAEAVHDRLAGLQELQRKGLFERTHSSHLCLLGRFVHDCVA